MIFLISNRRTNIPIHVICTEGYYFVFQKTSSSVSGSERILVMYKSYIITTVVLLLTGIIELFECIQKVQKYQWE